MSPRPRRCLEPVPPHPRRPGRTEEVRVGDHGPCSDRESSAGPISPIHALLTYRPTCTPTLLPFFLLVFCSTYTRTYLVTHFLTYLPTYPLSPSRPSTYPPRLPTYLSTTDLPISHLSTYLSTDPVTHLLAYVSLFLPVQLPFYPHRPSRPSVPIRTIYPTTNLITYPSPPTDRGTRLLIEGPAYQATCLTTPVFLSSTYRRSHHVPDPPTHLHVLLRFPYLSLVSLRKDLLHSESDPEFLVCESLLVEGSLVVLTKRDPPTGRNGSGPTGSTKAGTSGGVDLLRVLVRAFDVASDLLVCLVSLLDVHVDLVDVRSTRGPSLVFVPSLKVGPLGGQSLPRVWFRPPPLLPSLGPRTSVLGQGRPVLPGLGPLVPSPTSFSPVDVRDLNRGDRPPDHPSHSRPSRPTSPVRVPNPVTHPGRPEFIRRESQ